MKYRIPVITILQLHLLVQVANGEINETVVRKGNEAVLRLRYTPHTCIVETACFSHLAILYVLQITLLKN